MKLWKLITAATILMACTAGATTWIVSASFVHQVDEARTSVTTELEDAFDRGMGAGVEYQQWFCENPEYAAPVDSSSR